MKNLTIVWLFLCLGLGNGGGGGAFGAENDEKTTVLTHFVHGLIKHPKVLALLCWDSDDLFLLIKEFNKRELRIGVAESNIASLPSGAAEDDSVLLLDWQCPCTSDLLSKLNLSQYEQFKWIFINDMPEDDPNLFTTLNSHFIGVGSDIFVIRRRDTDTFVIERVYKVHRHATELSREFYATWSITENSFTNAALVPSITSRRRQNMHKNVVRASMVITHNDSLNHLDDYRDQHRDTIAKVNFILTNHLMAFMNATVQFSVVDTWGYLNKENNTWNGMIGELTDNKADIGATALFFTDNRISVIQYVAMTTKTLSKIVFQSPKLSYTDNVFLLPFSRIVWICVVVTVPTIAVALAMVMYAEWKVPLKPHDETDVSMLHPSLKDCLQLVFCALCQQGSSTIPKSFSGRLIMFLTFLILMFLFASYSANIVALLGAPSSKIKTLEDFLDSRLKMGADDTVFNRFYFPRQTEGTRRALYERKIVNKDGSTNFMSLDKGVALLRKGLYGFHFETGPGYKLISETFNEDEKCGLQEISFLQMIDPYYAIQKNSTMKEIIKIGLFRLYEHGIQHRENTRYYTAKPQCSGTGSKFISVSIIDVQPAILLLCWGFGFAGIAFLFETAMKRAKCGDRMKNFQTKISSHI
ncbi:glutamate receptor 3-like [Culicoides brevitarsis]|uniref:glutamate receptor 3-like n=1 Tax=Culicoides brevitarsis TaxID=469753 RepID=UPI00307B5301